MNILVYRDGVWSVFDTSRREVACCTSESAARAVLRLLAS